MNRALISLNFMHCMERFATQIYLTQRGVFNDDGTIAQKLLDASANEREHVDILRAQIKKLNGRVYPFGFLFKSVGIILGLITRLSGKCNLFKADTFVENRAVKDYTSFPRTVPFNTQTEEVIKGIIKEEEIHISNWQRAAASFKK